MTSFAFAVGVLVGLVVGLGIAGWAVRYCRGRHRIVYRRFPPRRDLTVSDLERIANSWRN